MHIIFYLFTENVQELGTVFLYIYGPWNLINTVYVDTPALTQSFFDIEKLDWKMEKLKAIFTKTLKFSAVPNKI